ncbi:MAG: helix-turn-helix domain-containing protein [Pseudonocardiaceae bacterium]
MKHRSFGQYVTHAREQCGYSMRQLAARLGVAPSTISRLEDGARSLPHPDLFLALINELELDVTVALALIPPYERLCKGAHMISPSHLQSTTRQGGSSWIS